MGLVRFVLMNGAVKLGGTLFLVNFAVDKLFRQPWTAESLIVEGGICLIAGLLGGFIIWIINEMRYWW